MTPEFKISPWEVKEMVFLKGVGATVTIDLNIFPAKELDRLIHFAQCGYTKGTLRVPAVRVFHKMADLFSIPFISSDVDGVTFHRAYAFTNVWGSLIGMLEESLVPAVAAATLSNEKQLTAKREHSNTFLLSQVRSAKEKLEANKPDHPGYIFMNCGKLGVAFHRAAEKLGDDPRYKKAAAPLLKLLMDKTPITLKMEPY